ncbi:MAG: tetratricopeptide repeat protein [Acidobacteriia bacterium]|nr:tetratricopeptide repeat protein [Terriglobia bacterium]
MKTAALFVLLSGVAGATSWRVDLSEARKLQTSGQGAKAESIYENMVNTAKGLPPGERNSMALELFYATRYREAEAAYHLALDGWALEGPSAASNRITTSANLATLLRTEGRYAEAESMLLDCLSQAEGVAGKDSLLWARGASGLAALYLVWEKTAQAETFALATKDTFENVNAPESERINNLSILASIYVQEARYDQAEPLLRTVLENANPRLLARTYNELAVIALRRSQFEGAESLALKALDAETQNAGSSAPLNAAIRNNLADICLYQGRYVEAEQHYREAIAIWESSLGKQHPDTAKAYLNLAAFYHRRGREAGAEQLYRRAATIFEKTLGTDHVLTLVAWKQLADVLRAEGRFTESERLGRAAPRQPAGQVSKGFQQTGMN